MTRERLNDLARTIIDSNRYMVLGTADPDGHPWVSPVWFASEDYKHFHWVSSPDARHSGNLAARPEVAIAIFDSTVPVGGAQAVYMSGRAEELTGDELERGSEVFGRLVGGGCRTQLGTGRPSAAVALPPLPGYGLGALPADRRPRPRARHRRRPPRARHTGVGNRQVESGWRPALAHSPRSRHPHISRFFGSPTGLRSGARAPGLLYRRGCGLRAGDMPRARRLSTHSRTRSGSAPILRPRPKRRVINVTQHLSGRGLARGGGAESRQPDASLTWHRWSMVATSDLMITPTPSASWPSARDRAQSRRSGPPTRSRYRNRAPSST